MIGRAPSRPHRPQSIGCRSCPARRSRARLTGLQSRCSVSWGRTAVHREACRPRDQWVSAAEPGSITPRTVSGTSIGSRRAKGDVDAFRRNQREGRRNWSPRKGQIWGTGKSDRIEARWWVSTRAWTCMDELRLPPLTPTSRSCRAASAAGSRGPAVLKRPKFCCSTS